MGEATSKTAISSCNPMLDPSLGREASHMAHIAGPLALCLKQASFRSGPKNPISMRQSVSRTKPMVHSNLADNKQHRQKSFWLRTLPDVQPRCSSLFKRMVTSLDAEWATQTSENVLVTSDSPNLHAIKCHLFDSKHPAANVSPLWKPCANFSLGQLFSFQLLLAKLISHGCRTCMYYLITIASILNHAVPCP